MGDYAKAIGEAQMPEGMTIDPVLAEAGGELMAKHGISADAAKDLASFFAQQQKAGADSSAKAFADQVSAWKGDAEKSTTPEERGAAKDAALKVFGKDEVAVMEAFGLTNRAGFIKALSKVGKALRELVVSSDNITIVIDQGPADAGPAARLGRATAGAVPERRAGAGQCAPR